MKNSDYQRCRDNGMGFTANVIITGCRKPKTKIRNLLKYIDAGHEVSQVQFSTYDIRIDGKIHDIGYLDKYHG